MTATFRGVADLAPAPTGMREIPTLAFVPSLGLVNLFTFAENDYVTTVNAGGLLDFVTGARVLPTGPTGGSNFWGVGPTGSLYLGGQQRLVTPNALDIRQPWTVVATMILALPAPGQRNAQVLSMGSYPTSGWAIALRLLADAHLGDQVGLQIQNSLDGAASGVWSRTRYPWRSTYAYVFTLVVRHFGLNQVRFEIRRAGQVSPFVPAWDMDRTSGASGSRQPLMRVTIGSTSAAMADTRNSYSFLATWQRGLPEDEVRMAVEAGQNAALVQGYLL